ncbi:hypothetical protein LOD99_12831 [Oopsacas minuta]|uniref:PARP-type domain-containing protein n=1 Tax=Oopsacas minuta TaxID=111878 RepID=A0AAV7JD50_9METZ|nr:hypothetical protein LOD99_12831 [Oopsacas minuta]
MSEEYWTVSRGLAVRNSNKCRECKQYIMMKEPIVIRDGRKIRLFYHSRCFSGSADPRSQLNGAFSREKYEGIMSPSAPKEKGNGKWSCRSYGYTPDYDVLSKMKEQSNEKKHMLKGNKELKVEAK